MEENRSKSLILKVAMLATGLSGIVAEYILSTLASYFLGDSILQWTLVLSFMLFSMGLGSRLTPFLHGHLLEKFILIEFLLSGLVSFSALTVYLLAAFSSFLPLVIYGLSILIGLLIGMEIPLVTRLNEEYEALRLNIAGVMAYDYFGSLLGGLFFAFVGLPILGLSYTPFVLGLLNFSVAIYLFWRFRRLVVPRLRLRLTYGAFGVALILLAGLLGAKPLVLFGEQQRYADKVIFAEQSKYQRIVITQWKNDYWLFLNGSQQFSTRDEELYHEPLVHPVVSLSPDPAHVLVLGGGDGLAVRELLKHKNIKKITLVDLDPAMTRLAKTHPVLLDANDRAFFHPRVKILNRDAFKFMSDTRQYFDVIIIDLPDPKTVELNRLYTREFYRLCFQQLRPQGLIITQSGSPYYSGKAFECIRRTMVAAGFGVVQMHNQVLTLGEWGWTIGSKSLHEKQLKEALRRLRFEHLPTRWLNAEAMLQMTSFGKRTYFFDPEQEKVETNTIHNPVLYRYYLNGGWDLY
ncbi:MAG: polyamine aminopropyltransferase [Microscillaceae bacterium]